MEQPQVEGGETAQKNLANESGAWVKNPTGTDGKPGSPAGADKPAAGDKKDEKGEDKAGADKKDAPVDASADSHATSGLSLLGLLQQDKQQSPKDQWNKVADKTYQNTHGDTVKVVDGNSSLFSKYEFGSKALDLSTNAPDQSKTAAADKAPPAAKDQATTGSYLDMQSGTLVKPDKAGTGTPTDAPKGETAKDAAPSATGLAWLKEVTSFFGFGDKTSPEKPQPKDSTDKQPVQTHEFTDKSGHPVKVEAGDGKAVHESDGVRTVKNADGVLRTDKTATTEWSQGGKVEVTSADKEVKFKQDGQNATLDFNKYTVTKLPGDKFQFTDKQTGKSVEFAGPEVREQLGKSIILAVNKGQDLDKAVDQERTKNGKDHLVAATDGKGTTLIKEPDGVRILIKEGQSATATYPDGTQISSEADGTRKIKDKSGHITVLKPGEEAPKDLKLPPGVGFDKDGQLCLLKSGVAIDKSGHMHAMHGVHVDMQKNEIQMQDETTGKYAKLINHKGATTITSPDGTVLNNDGDGHTTVTTARGETVKYDADKQELATSKGTFTPDHVTLWNGETVYKDSSVRFSNGDVIARDGSATFADGTRFSAAGMVSTSDGWHTQVHYSHGSLSSTDHSPRTVDSGFVQHAINIYTGAEVSAAALNKSNITDADIASAEADLGNLDSLIALLSRKGATGPASALAGLRGELLGAINNARARLGQQADNAQQQKDAPKDQNKQSLNPDQTPLKR